MNYNSDCSAANGNVAALIPGIITAPPGSVIPEAFGMVLAKGKKSSKNHITDRSPVFVTAGNDNRS